MVAFGMSTCQPCLIQALDQHIAPLAVVIANLLHAFLRAFQSLDGSHLDRRERSVVEIALNPTQRSDQRLDCRP